MSTTSKPQQSRANRKKPRQKGATAMRHARAIAAELYPGAASHEAKATIRWICGRPMNVSEDHFGISDLTLLFRGDLIFLQVTSEAGAGARRARLRRWWEEYRAHIPACAELLVWAWVARKHMKRWRWDPVAEKWIRLAPLRAS